GLSLVVAAEGENPPRETVDSLFDGDLESKWLDFIAGPGNTNRPSWIEWQYIPRVKERIVNRRWLVGARAQEAAQRQMRLTGLVTAWNPENKQLGFLDESGFESLQLAGDTSILPAGERIQLTGRLTY